MILIKELTNSINKIKNSSNLKRYNKILMIAQKIIFLYRISYQVNIIVNNSLNSLILRILCNNKVVILEHKI